MRICFCDDEASTRSQFERMAAAWAEQRGEAAGDVAGYGGLALPVVVITP